MVSIKKKNYEKMQIIIQFFYDLNSYIITDCYYTSSSNNHYHNNVKKLNDYKKLKNFSGKYRLEGNAIWNKIIIKTYKNFNR